MKRFLDILCSAVLLILLSPLFLILVISIKLTSKGPVLFKQRRIGKENKEFLLYKFRSMRIDAPNVATHLLEDPDKYITSIGKFLRKSSLDELPQLINILKGEMTFVGPRPALYNQYDLIEMRTKAGVHKLIPGVTGWAQINGRDEIELDEKVKYDKYYLENRSILLDIKTVFLTFFKVLKAEGISEGKADKDIVMEYNEAENVKENI